MNASRKSLIAATIFAVVTMYTGPVSAEPTSTTRSATGDRPDSTTQVFIDDTIVDTPTPFAQTAAAAGRPAPFMAIDNSSRASVLAAYQKWFKPALATPVGWRGNIATCDAGTPSTAGQNATISMVNYLREMVHVDPVRFDAALSAKAQKAALIMEANSALSHYPDSSWTCWTLDGYNAAGKSNLSLGYGGAQAVFGQMTDAGSNNLAAGHRRWITSAESTLMGAGSTNWANALWVVGDRDPEATMPTVVAWPTPGYFPSALEPHGRWSFNIPAAGPGDPDPFENVHVTVRETTGKTLPVTIVDRSWGYGTGTTMVFEVGGISFAPRHADKGYRVTISGINDPRFPPNYTYYITMFDGDSAPPPTTTLQKPRVIGAINSLTVSGKTITFTGWAQGIGRNAELVISRNGRTIGSIVATRPRTDGTKGWQYKATVPAGKYTFCAHFPNPTAKTGWTASCGDVVVK